MRHPVETTFQLNKSKCTLFMYVFVCMYYVCVCMLVRYVYARSRGGFRMLGGRIFHSTGAAKVNA